MEATTRGIPGGHRTLDELEPEGPLDLKPGGVLDLELAVDAPPAMSAREASRRRDSTIRRALAAADVLAVTLAVGLAIAIGGGALRAEALVVPLVFVGFVKALGLYDRDKHLLHRTTLDEIPSLFGLATLTTLLIWLADGRVIEGSFDRAQVVITWGLLFVLVISLRALAREIGGRISPVERCLFVGDAPSAEILREKLTLSHSVRAELVAWLPMNGRRRDDDPARSLTPTSIAEILQERQVERVVVGSGISEQLLDEIRQLPGDVKVSIMPAVTRVVTSSVEVDRLNGIALLGMRPLEITLSSQLIKRAFDLVGSVVALILAIPVLVMAAVAIKLESRGPVLFRQRRAGRHGKEFNMLKLRSMVDGADELKPTLEHLNEADGVFKIADDPRVTRVGRFIRRTHLDEVPQLVNVLRGEMSLVGPRPLPLDEDRRIQGWRRRRLDLRPGITGPWQILGSAQVPVREMVKLDYQYVANWSLWNDVRILLLTVGRVARRTGL